jgi:hypothetical protein
MSAAAPAKSSEILDANRPTTDASWGNTRGPHANKKRLAPVLAGVGGACAIFAIAFFALHRTPEAAAPQAAHAEPGASNAPAKTTVPAATAPPNVPTVAPAPTAEPPRPSASAEAAPTASATAAQGRPPAPKPARSPGGAKARETKPSKPGGHEDIWAESH